MSFFEAANHSLIYILVTIGILYVAAFSIVSLLRSWKRAQEIGYTKSQLMSVVKSSLSLTVVPAISIVIGVFTLATLLGVPWPWWRLSVVGALGYELMAADLAITSAGVSIMDVASATSTEFVLIMFVMTIGIMGGLLVSLFLAKRIQAGTLKNNAKDVRWGALGNSMFMLVLVIVFVMPMLFKGVVTVLTLLTSIVLAVVLGGIAKKTGAVWLTNFILAFCIIGSMAMSVVWTNLFG